MSLKYNLFKDKIDFVCLFLKESQLLSPSTPFQSHTSFQIMKTTIYCRISSLNQTQGVSLEAQLEECNQVLHFNKQTADSVVQEVCSAYESTPPLLAILTRKRNHRVVFHAVDRFSRNVLNGVENAKQMLKYHCELIFVRERLVVRKTEGAEWLRLMSLITQAEAESKAISLRVKSTISFLKKHGYQHSSHVPYGFSAMPDPAKPHLNRLHPNTTENAIVKFIVLCRTKGSSIGDINKALREFSPSAYKNPIVIEWTDKGETTALSFLKYAMSYDDIAYFLNEYGMVYRGKKWDSSNVSSVYRRFFKRNDADEVNELSFDFSLSDDEDDDEESDSRDENGEEMKIDSHGWQVFPPNLDPSTRFPSTRSPSTRSPSTPFTPPATNFMTRIPSAPRKSTVTKKYTEKH